MDLPEEILINIFEYLSHSDLLCARIVCKAFYCASVSHCFTKNEALVLRDIGNEFRVNREALNMDILMNINRVFKTVKITDSYSDGQYNIVKIFQKFGSSILEVHFTNCQINAFDFRNILEYCNNLESLNIYGCYSIITSGFHDFNEKYENINYGTLPNLKAIRIQDTKFMTDLTFCRIMNQSEKINTLGFEDSRIVFSSSTTGFFYPPNIDCLEYPTKCGFTFIYILKIIEKYSSQIKNLDFSCSLIDIPSVKSLCTIVGLKLDKLKLKKCRELTRNGPMLLGTWQPEITELDISFCSGIKDNAFIDICNKMKNLTVLNISGCNLLTDIGISALSELKKLVTLHMSNCNQVRGESLIDADGLFSRINPSMTDFEAANNQLNENIIIQLANSFVNLVSLNLYRVPGVTDKSLSVLFERLRKLRRLSISQCSFSNVSLTGGVCVDVEQYQNNIEEIIKQRFNDVINTSALNSLRGLTHLDLSCTSVTDETLFVMHLKELLRLNLESTKITMLGLSYLVSRSPAIEVLTLVKTPITDKAIDIIAQNLKRLTHLNLANCHNITDESLKSIIKHCKKLQELNLSGCFEMSTDLVKQVKEIPVKLFGCPDQPSYSNIPPPPDMHSHN